MLRVLGGKLSCCPATCLSGVGVEVYQANLPHRGQVVIPGYQYVVHAQHRIQAGRWIWSVPHRIAQTPYLVYSPMFSGVGQNSVEGLQVAVDVGEYGYSHDFKDPFVLRAKYSTLPLWPKFGEDIMRTVKVREIGEFTLIQSLQKLVCQGNPVSEGSAHWVGVAPLESWSTQTPVQFAFVEHYWPLSRRQMLSPLQVLA